MRNTNGMPRTNWIGRPNQRKRNGRVYTYQCRKVIPLSVPIRDVNVHYHCDALTECPLVPRKVGERIMPKTITIANTKGKTATEVAFTEATYAYLKDNANLKAMLKGEYTVLEFGEDFTLSRDSKNPGNLAFKRIVEWMEHEKVIPEGYRVQQSTQVPKTQAALRFVKAD